MKYSTKNTIDMTYDKRLEILKNNNQSNVDRLNTIILDGIDIKFIENYLRKRKLIKLNTK